MKKTIRNLLVAHIFISLLILFHYREFSLHSYINASFIVGGGLFFIGLIAFIFSTGFFDLFTLSMRKVLTPKRRMDDMGAMRKPSEIFSANVSPLFTCGGLILAVMSIVLIFYYL